MCSNCNQEKEYKFFSKRAISKDGFRSQCKICIAKYQKIYRKKSSTSIKLYNKNYRISEKTKLIAKKRLYQKRAITRNKLFISSYLDTHFCINCNESNKPLLQFDHLLNKKSKISSLVKLGYSLSTILSEISKCQVLCANCHRIKTATTHRFYRVSSQYLSKNQAIALKQETLLSFLKNSCCSKCKNANIVVLEYHHVHPTTKIASISEMTRQSKYTIDDIKEEISKCILLCANCHLLEHHHQ